MFRVVGESGREGRVNLSDDENQGYFFLIPSSREGPADATTWTFSCYGCYTYVSTFDKCVVANSLYLCSTQTEVYLLFGIHRGHTTPRMRWLMDPSVVRACKLHPETSSSVSTRDTRNADKSDSYYGP